jgi:hypothetical protein
MDSWNQISIPYDWTLIPKSIIEIFIILKARCVISGFEGDLEGGASKGGKKMKHLELNKIRIS